jgi:hypothetical protein
MATLPAPQFADITKPPNFHDDAPKNPQHHLSKTPPKDLPFLMDGDFLKVKNDDSRVVVFRWARKYYTLEPGQEMFVIFEALVDALGDPRSCDTVPTVYNDGNGSMGVVMERYAELTRLFARYGIEQENIDLLVAVAPKVRIETLSGQKVHFPSQRPDMLPFPVPMVDDRAVNSDPSRMIDSVAAENAELRERVSSYENRLDEMQRRIEELSTAKAE